MSGSRIPRRVFIKSFGVALLVSGCAPALTPFATEPTATPLPTPTPTPLPSADAVVQAYLAAWSALKATGPYAEFIERWSNPAFADYVRSLEALAGQYKDDRQQSAAT